MPIPRVMVNTIKRANPVRLYLRVITVADLADPSGAFILDGMLQGDWQAGAGSNILGAKSTKASQTVLGHLSELPLSYLLQIYTAHQTPRKWYDTRPTSWNLARSHSKYLVPSLSYEQLAVLQRSRQNSSSGEGTTDLWLFPFQGDN